MKTHVKIGSKNVMPSQLMVAVATSQPLPRQLPRHRHTTDGFFHMSFVKKRTVIHWSDIKLKQLNGCRNLKIFNN